MATLACPSCYTAMQEIAEPDISIDQCPKCEGIFLDKGELNILAAVMSRDVEYFPIDEELHKNTFPTRICPKCSNQAMRKINLLTLSDLIFDFCPTCEGFFLDVGELEAMHA